MEVDDGSRRIMARDLLFGVLVCTSFELATDTLLQFRYNYTGIMSPRS